MLGVNLRGTYLCTQACLPHLARFGAAGAQPARVDAVAAIDPQAQWFGPHVAYSIAKYGMSLCVLGHAEELRPHGIGVKRACGQTVILTAALKMIPGVRRSSAGALRSSPMRRTRSCAPDPRTTSGNFF